MTARFGGARHDVSAAAEVLVGVAAAAPTPTPLPATWGGLTGSPSSDVVTSFGPLECRGAVANTFDLGLSEIGHVGAEEARDLDPEWVGVESENGEGGLFDGSGVERPRGEGRGLDLEERVGVLDRLVDDAGPVTPASRGRCASRDRGLRSAGEADHGHVAPSALATVLSFMTSRLGLPGTAEKSWAS